MSASIFAKERAIAIRAVLDASKVSQLVSRQLISQDTLVKNDKSPVTVADYSAQAIVNAHLTENFPADPIVGEEDTKGLKGDMRKKVLELTNSVFEQKMSEEKLLQFIDRGSHAGGPKGRMWVLDPIDGTLGFLRGGQYAVCLALIVDGEVQVGVMGCPNLPVDYKNPASSEKGTLFIAVRGEGSFQRSFDDATESPIHFNPLTAASEGVFCESFESSHSSHGDAAKIASLLGVTRPPVRMDSQAKYCSISRGDGNIYLRLPVNANYVEKIWDHASGSLLVTEAGGAVSDVQGKPLDFSVGRELKRNKGIIACNANIHAEVLKATREALEGNNAQKEEL